jgi:hypothetical protein
LLAEAALVEDWSAGAPNPTHGSTPISGAQPHFHLPIKPSRQLISRAAPPDEFALAIRGDDLLGSSLSRFERDLQAKFAFPTGTYIQKMVSGFRDDSRRPVSRTWEAKRRNSRPISRNFA